MHVGEDGVAYADRSPIGEDGPRRFEAWRSVIHPIELYQRLRTDTDALSNAEARLTYLDSVKQGDSEEASHQRRVRQHHLEEVARILDEMMRAGLRLPSYYQHDLVEDLKGTGLLRNPELLATFVDRRGNEGDPRE